MDEPPLKRFDGFADEKRFGVALVVEPVVDDVGGFVVDEDVVSALFVVEMLP